MDETLVLTLDPTYFRLSGGIERWLYRLVRKHGGRQPAGWRFEMRHLHLKSGSLQRHSDFALQVRQLARRQALPGYQLTLERSGGIEWLAFRPGQAEPSKTDLSTASVEEPVDGLGMGSVDQPHDPRWIARRTIGGSPAPISREAAPSNGFGPL
jgi:plasmid replication initiation protein